MRGAIVVAGVVATMGWAAAGRGQTPPAADRQPAVTFKTGVDLVAVDVSVVDRRGRPVSDLSPEDFVLTVDGKPRRLVTAQFVSQTRQMAPRPRPEGVSTNAAAAGGRLIMLVVDQANIRRGSGKVIADAAGRFIDRLAPADRVGLTVIPGAGQNVDFTANHALVKTLISRIVGRAERRVDRYHVGVYEAMEIVQRNNRFVLDNLTERECGAAPDEQQRLQCRQEIQGEARAVLSSARFRTSESLVALRGLLGRLAGSLEPKTVVLVSEGLVLEDRRAQLSWVGPLAATAQASLYVLRLEGTLWDTFEQRVSGSVADDLQLEIEGLEMLAGMARGAIFPVTANTDFVFERLELELSGYYLLSFEPEGTDRDGRTHAIKVEVRRDDVEVRARREFSVDTTRAAMTEEDLLAETLRPPLLATEIPVAVTTYTFRDIGSNKLKVIIAAEVDRGQQPVGDVSLAYALVDNQGQLAASQIEKRVVGAEGGEAGVLPYSTAVLVEPGIYTLTFAALDGDGHRGSVEHTFRAQLQSAGQLRFGELMLAQIRNGTTLVRPVVDPALTADSVYAYLELYSDAEPQLQDASVSLEVAADPNAGALESSVFRMQETEAGQRRVGEGRVPIAFLPPGEYVARAIVSVSGRPVARVTRPFTLTRELPAAARVAGAPVEPGATPRLAIRDSIDRFSPDSVLDSRVTGFFLDRLFITGATPPAAVQPLVGHARAGRFDEILAELGNLSPAAAREVAPVFLHGLALLARRDLEAAAARFRESLRLDSEFFPAAFFLGACYAAGGRDREAVGAWQTSLVAEDEAPFVWTLLGDALLRLNEGVQAAEILREAASLWPEDDQIRVRLGLAYVMSGGGADALATLDPYFDRHPEDHARLFVAMRLLYEATAAGRPVGTAAEDLARFTRYARSYAAAGGPQIALVEQWHRFLESRSRQ